MFEILKINNDQRKLVELVRFLPHRNAWLTKGFDYADILLFGVPFGMTQTYSKDFSLAAIRTF